MPEFDLRIKYEKVISYVIIITSVIIYLMFLIPANLDLSRGSYYLHMDERISFDAINNILHPKEGLLKALVAGDQRYGRITYIISAAFSFFPEKLWGQAGQIISVRMLMFILLLSSYFIIANTFLKNKIYKALAIALLLCIPTTAYYSTMPKPEPFQLFFFSIFLSQYIRYRYQFGWHFFWLGLAFGCKISILFVALYIILISALNEYTENDRSIRDVIRSGFTSMLAFGIGLGIAVPILLLGILKIKYLKLYVDNTFMNTAHGGDDLTVNIIVWISRIFQSWLEAPLILSILTVFFILLIISIGVLRKYWQSQGQFLRSRLFLLTALAILFILPVMLLAKRVWFFYLHIGCIFLIIAFLSSIIFLSDKNRMITYLARFSLILVLVFSFSFLFVQQRKELIILSQRTKTADYTLQNQRFEYLSSILTDEHKKNPGKEISVYYSPQFFRFENTGFSVEMIYGYFVNWDKGRSYVFLCNSNNPKTLIPTSVTGAEYELWKQALAEYDKHVGYRASSPAYIKLPQKIDGLFVFKRIR